MKYFKIKKIIYISVLILVCGGIAFLMISKNKKQSFIFENESILKEENNYNIRINYPKFSNYKFNKKIKKMVDNEKKFFLKEVKNLETNKIYDLSINYDCTHFGNLYSIHFKTFFYLGGAHYERKDISYYYDAYNKQEIFLDDLFKEGIYEVLEAKSRNYLAASQYVLFKDESFDEGIKGTAKNYSLISFESDYLYIIFPPYQIGPWSTGEVRVPVNYFDLRDYLNEKYFNINDLKVTPSNDVDGEFKDESDDNVSNETTVNKIRDKQFFKDKKLIAFTFDDGPTWSLTNNFLDELDKRNARVSFFVLGQRASSQKTLIKKIYNHGHSLGSHTFDHKNLLNLSADEAAYEINQTNEILLNITGENPKFLRPPYGNYNQNLLESTEMIFILWNVDTKDWKLRNAEKISKYIIENVEDGSIVLLHDLYKESIEAALLAMDELEKEGYAFVSLDEMASIKGISLEKHHAYRYIK